MSFLNFHKIKNHALKWRDFLFDLFFPKYCVHCKKEGEWLCSSCFPLLSFKKQYCPECKKENKNGFFCSQCKNKYFLDGALIAGDYDQQILAELIKKLKYNFAKDISKILAQFLNNFILKYQKENNLDLKNFLFIPVPLHKKKKNFRGFNQSEEINKELSSLLNLKSDSKNLIRIKNTKAQAKLNAKERKENVKNSFFWKGENLKRKNIILLDDVFTTGATLDECARILKENGAGQVLGLTVAKG